MHRACCLALISLLLLAFSCEEDALAPRPIDFHYDYFPLAIGREWIYEVDSLTPRLTVDGVVLDSVRLLMRERLIDTFTDASGQLWYLGNRAERERADQDWEIKGTFLLGRTELYALRQEGNLFFQKLLFPPALDKSWDGNAAFDEQREIPVGETTVRIFAGWNYGYRSLHTPSAPGLLPVDSAVVVRAADIDNLLSRRFAEEHYGIGIGLLYREWEVFDTQCDICCGGAGNTSECLALPWRAKAEKGYLIRQRLIDYR